MESGARDGRVGRDPGGKAVSDPKKKALEIVTEETIREVFFIDPEHLRIVLKVITMSMGIDVKMIGGEKVITECSACGMPLTESTALYTPECSWGGRQEDLPICQECLASIKMEPGHANV